MPLTTEQLSVVRSWVGSTPTDVVLNERYTRLLSLDAVVRESLRTQLSGLLAQPGNITLPSGLSITTQANITSLQSMIKEFENAPSLDDTTAINKGVSFSRLHRKDSR